jgi:cellulose biosynthesis protein BcsQ
MAAKEHDADIILADVGPTLGAINRSALIASDYVVIPLAADLFSLQGLRNLGPTLQRWRTEWKDRHDRWMNPEFNLPDGAMQPIGYVLMQHSERDSRPVQAYRKWADRIPQTYEQSVLGAKSRMSATHMDHCLAKLKHYRSLAPMAQEKRKPIFKLTSADGAIGAHLYAAREAGDDFKELATKILERIQLKELADSEPNLQSCVE